MTLSRSLRDCTLIGYLSHCGAFTYRDYIHNGLIVYLDLKSTQQLTHWGSFELLTMFFPVPYTFNIHLCRLTLSTTGVRKLTLQTSLIHTICSWQWGVWYRIQGQSWAGLSLIGFARSIALSLVVAIFLPSRFSCLLESVVSLSLLLYQSSNLLPFVSIFRLK